MQPAPAPARPPYVSSITIPSGPGWRVVYFAEGYEPVLSLWSQEQHLLPAMARSALQELAEVKAGARLPPLAKHWA